MPLPYAFILLRTTNLPNSAPPIGPSCSSCSFKAARRRKLSSDGSAAIASGLPDRRNQAAMRPRRARNHYRQRRRAVVLLHS